MHKSGRAVYEGHRDGDWKLILRKKGPASLYDLAADPFEKHDLAAERPAVVERLSEIARADAENDEPRLPPDLEGVPEW